MSALALPALARAVKVPRRESNEYGSVFGTGPQKMVRMDPSYGLIPVVIAGKLSHIHAYTD